MDLSSTFKERVRGEMPSTVKMKRVVRLLDIECSDDNTYYRLLNGFTTVQKRNKLLAEQLAAPQESSSDVGHSEAPTEAFDSPNRHLQTSRSNHTPTQPSRKQVLVEAESPASLFASPPRWMWDKSPSSLNCSDDQAAIRSCMVLPPEFLGWKSAGTQVWARLRFAGLEVIPVFNYDLTRVVLKV